MTMLRLWAPVPEAPQFGHDALRRPHLPPVPSACNPSVSYARSGARPRDHVPYRAPVDRVAVMVVAK